MMYIFNNKLQLNKFNFNDFHHFNYRNAFNAFNQTYLHTVKKRKSEGESERE